MTAKTVFSSEGHRLEGLLEKNSPRKGVVIAHPHPLYGGDLNNSVVYAIMRAYQANEYTTLRFNFRGVGGSQGSYADGVGEQEDVRAAAALLTDMGIRQIDLAGYSFGAWVISRLDRDSAAVANKVLVSPPVAFMDFSSIKTIAALGLIVTGSRDDIAPPEMIRPLFQKWNTQARLEVIDGADHFYGGHTGKLRSLITSYLSELEKKV